MDPGSVRVCNRADIGQNHYLHRSSVATVRGTSKPPSFLAIICNDAADNKGYIIVNCIAFI